MNQPYAFIVRAKTRPERADAFHALFASYVAPSRAEPGCIEYHMLRDHKDPSLFIFYEIWESQAHLDVQVRGAYAMSKAALTSFTRGLSRELGPNGITVNLVQPGATNTDTNPADGEAADFQRSLTSLGRYAEPREIANAVVILASPAASVITRAVLTADGGAIA